MGEIVRATRAVVARVALAVAVLAAGGVGLAEPTGAQVPPIVVEPSTGLVDGQEVTVTVNGPQLFVTICDAEVGENPTLDDAVRHCGQEATVVGDERPAQLAYVVRSSFTAFGGRVVDCGVEPGDCVISAAGLAASGFVSTPITIGPPVLTAALPGEPLGDDTPVAVTVRGAPGAVVTVAQCAYPTGATLAASRCGPGLALQVGADGTASESLAVTFEVGTGAGVLDCQAATCGLAAFDAGGALLRALPLTFQERLALAVQPAAGLTDGSLVLAIVTGHRDGGLGLLQCRAGAGPGDIATACTSVGITVPAGSNTEYLPVNARASFTTGSGVEVTCDGEPGACVVALGASGTPQWAAVPVTFAEVALAPSATGLHDGQPVTLSATGLIPDISYRVLRCDPTRAPACEPEPDAPLVTSGADGTLEAETTAAQRFTSGPLGGPEYCRDECTFRLAPDAWPLPWDISVPYAMAEGSVAASPSSGLADGDTVTLSGSDLMASYDGPPFWVFPSTGGWGIGQCGAGVVDDPTIVGVFTHCTVAPPGTVDVAGSTATVEVPVASAFTSILGHEVDCASGPEVCVVVMARIEQDGSVSVHAAPVTFADASGGA
jgi:hypothetical protein